MLRWLRKRALRLPAGPLTEQQERDIQECFKMLDEDGSGALDVSELVKAFKMLGFKADPTSVRALMTQVQGEARKELQEHEFRALMAHSLSSEPNSGQDSGSSGVPFQEIARATRRKQALHKVITGGSSRQQLIDDNSRSQGEARPSKPATRAKVRALQQSGYEDTLVRTADSADARLQAVETEALRLVAANMDVPWDQRDVGRPRWKLAKTRGLPH